MSRSAVIVPMVLCLAVISQPVAKADSSVQDVIFNVNGTITQSAFPTIANAGGYDVTTGLGTVILTFNPGTVGPFFVDAGFDLSVGNQGALTVPFWNEYGASSGTLAAGQSWIVGAGANPNSTGSAPPFNTGPPAGEVFGAVATGGTLGNTNSIPGTSDNYLQNCAAGATCNNDVALGMGFNFNLASGQEALITLAFSTTAPTGFFLSQTHPIDASNNTATTIYFTGSEVTQPVGIPPVPEPSSLCLLGVAFGTLSLLKLRK